MEPPTPWLRGPGWGPRRATVDFSASRAPGGLGSGLPTLVYHGRIPVLWGAERGTCPLPVDQLVGPVLTGAGGDVSPPRPS